MRIVCVRRSRQEKKGGSRREGGERREREREITGLGFINTLEDKLAS